MEYIAALERTSQRPCPNNQVVLGRKVRFGRYQKDLLVATITIAKSRRLLTDNDAKECTVLRAD
jgi:hypothetical protein